MTLAQFLAWAAHAHCIVWVHPTTQWFYRGGCPFAVKLAGWLHLPWTFLP